MRIASSAAVLATAMLAASVTAASLDVEPVETTTMTNNNTVNATDDGHAIGTQRTRCSIMKNDTWDDIKYSCVWAHGGEWSTSYNHFHMSYTNYVIMECGCDQGLWNYNPWGKRWTYSWNQEEQIFCYTRDGKDVNEVKHLFDAYTCYN